MSIKSKITNNLIIISKKNNNFNGNEPNNPAWAAAHAQA